MGPYPALFFDEISTGAQASARRMLHGACQTLGITMGQELLCLCYLQAWTVLQRCPLPKP